MRQKNAKLELTTVGVYVCLCMRRKEGCLKTCPDHKQKLRHFISVPEVELMRPSSTPRYR